VIGRGSRPTASRLATLLTETIQEAQLQPTRIPLVLGLTALLLVAACGGGGSTAGTPTPRATVSPWPAPSNPLDLAQSAGLVLENKEFLLYHVHAHLDMFLNGDKVLVPAGIGININDPGVQHGPGPSYGGIKLCNQPCISQLHTHTIDGVLHTESKQSTPNTLGQFFTEWNVKLDANCVGDQCEPATSIKVYVNGSLYRGNPAGIQLTDKKEIAIVIGTPPAGKIPKEFPG
jgi:hypothetical protein